MLKALTVTDAGPLGNSDAWQSKPFLLSKC